jgi:hypothetical protein
MSLLETFYLQTTTPFLPERTDNLMICTSLMTIILSIFIPFGHFYFFSYIIFFALSAWTQGLHLELLHQPFLCVRNFWDRILWTICPGWLRTMILLTSASWVAGLQTWATGTQLLFLFLFEECIFRSIF